MDESRYKQGMKVRRAVLGNAHVDRAESNKDEFDAEFQQMITEFAWGTVWSEHGIDRATKHLLTIGILAALGRENELSLHLRAIQNTGVTPEQVKQVFHQVAVYAGIPAANSAFAVAKPILKEMDAEA